MNLCSLVWFGLLASSWSFAIDDIQQRSSWYKIVSDGDGSYAESRELSLKLVFVSVILHKSRSLEFQLQHRLFLADIKAHLHRQSVALTDRSWFPVNFSLQFLLNIKFPWQLTTAVRRSSIVCVSRQSLSSLTFWIVSSAGPVWENAWWYSTSG